MPACSRVSAFALFSKYRVPLHVITHLHKTNTTPNGKGNERSRIWKPITSVFLGMKLHNPELLLNSLTIKNNNPRKKCWCANTAEKRIKKRKKAAPVCPIRPSSKRQPGRQAGKHARDVRAAAYQELVGAFLFLQKVTRRTRRKQKLARRETRRTKGIPARNVSTAVATRRTALVSSTTACTLPAFQRYLSSLSDVSS